MSLPSRPFQVGPLVVLLILFVDRKIQMQMSFTQRREESCMSFFFFDSVISFKANTVNQVMRKSSGSGLPGKMAKSFLDLELLNGKIICIHLNFNLVTNPFPHIVLYCSLPVSSLPHICLRFFHLSTNHLIRQAVAITNLYEVLLSRCC